MLMLGLNLQITDYLLSQGNAYFLYYEEKRNDGFNKIQVKKWSDIFWFRAMYSSYKDFVL